MKTYKELLTEVNQKKLKFFDFVYSDLDNKFGNLDPNKTSTFNKIVSYLKDNLPKWGNVVSNIATSFLDYKKGTTTKEKSIKNLIKILDNTEKMHESTLYEKIGY